MIFVSSPFGLGLHLRRARVGKQKRKHMHLEPPERYLAALRLLWMLMKKENVGLMLASGARLSTFINYATDIQQSKVEAVNPHARSPALMC